MPVLFVLGTLRDDSKFISTVGGLFFTALQNAVYENSEVVFETEKPIKIVKMLKLVDIGHRWRYIRAIDLIFSGYFFSLLTVSVRTF